MKEWLFNVASSPEFWKSLIGFFTAGGVTFAPDQQNAIIGLGLALMATVNAYKHVTRNTPAK